MRKAPVVPLLWGMVPFLVFLFYGPRFSGRPGPSDSGPERERVLAPADWFYFQRAYPLDTLPRDAVRRAQRQARALQRAFHRQQLHWEPAGPVNIGGRITALAVHPNRPNVVFAGAADGGVLRSDDGGLTWTPIFDTMPSLSIGALAIAPDDPDRLYVGTGEANSSGDSFDGTGLYMSPDGGQTWVHLGLEGTAHIARITIHPQNPDLIFVAAMGTLFSPNPERGLYRSRDGGQTWERVLFVNDTTGCIDVVVHPQDTNIVYAAMWQRIRGPGYRWVAGEGSGIYRSTDGGNTWEELTNGLPTGPDVGRIGLAISASDPDILYAIYADHPGYFMGLYKTTNGGDSWFRTNDGALSWIYSSYGWFFGNVRVDPTNPNVVYALGIDAYKSMDGGNSWFPITNWIHVDQHDLWIDPDDPNHLIIGNDGGVYISTNGGSSWTRSADLPITQFYDITVDFLNPQRLYGGTQDNGTVRTLTGALNDWEIIYWGDGFHVIVDYTNPNIIYAEYQYGGLGKSVDGGYSFFDATAGIDENDRRNWDTPVAMDPVNPQVLYYGTYRVYKTTNGAGYWYPVSGDLTNGPGGGNLNFGTLTAIAVSPADPNFVYVGADDGNVWVSTDGGGSWQRISDALPNRWVTDIGLHPTDPGVVYVTFSGYVWDERVPYIFLSTDTGHTWQDVTGNLPMAPVNAVVVDPQNPSWVYVGTDVGVFYSETGGTQWQPLGEGLPTSVVMDLAFHAPTRTLVAGTHGRSMFKLVLPPVEVAERPSGVSGHLALAVSVSQNHLGVRYTLPGRTLLTLSLWDVTGRRVRVLKRSEEGPGVFVETFPLPALPSGAYFLRIEAEGRSMARKVLILR